MHYNPFVYAGGDLSNKSVLASYYSLPIDSEQVWSFNCDWGVIDSLKHRALAALQLAITGRLVGEPRGQQDGTDSMISRACSWFGTW
jgi:hypothetical protein